MFNIVLLLTGFKGYFTLKRLLGFKHLIKHIVVAREKGVQFDFCEKIKFLCAQENIAHSEYTGSGKLYEIADNKDTYVIAIGWKFMLKFESSRLLIFHDSLLPKLRGFNPLVTALKLRHPEIGATVIEANDRVDSGNILLQRKISVNYPIRINNALIMVAHLYAEMAYELIYILTNNYELASVEQDEINATYSVWRDEDDYKINWEKSSQEILDHINSASFPYLGASTYVKNTKYRVFRAAILNDLVISNRVPGKIIYFDGDLPVVICGVGIIKLVDIRNDIDTSRVKFKLKTRFT